jgi:hypothetical protein
MEGVAALLAEEEGLGGAVDGRRFILAVGTEELGGFVLFIL